MRTLMAPPAASAAAAGMLAVLAGLLAAAPARAADDIALGSLDLYPTIASVSVVVPFTGDDNANVVARVEYRLAGAAAFTPGHPLVPILGTHLAGSVLFLEPDTSYDVRVVATDPDNAGPIMLQGSVRTRPDTPAPPAGRSWFVDAASGSDAAAGDASAPLATIGEGARRAQPGDAVHVRQGVYREQVVPPRGGSPGAPIWFVADGARVVLDGSDPALESGAPWTDAGGGLYWTPFAGASIYAAIDDARLYDYQSLADLQQENGNVATPGVFPGGFFVDAAAGRLYVITPDHSSPAAHQVHVAVLPSAFLLDTITDVVVQGFEMRYFGRDASYGGIGVDVRDSARCWIRDNTIHHVNDGVRVRRSLSSENVIERNSVRDTSVHEWPWSSVKAHTPEASSVSILEGHGNVVRWNQLEGTFNGIYTGAFGDADEDIARDTDVYENSLALHGDDGLELEGAQRNVREWENVVRDVYNAISLAPIEAGPVFLVRNVVLGYSQHVLKVNNGTYGWVFIYHTTAVPRPGATTPDAQAIEPSVPFGAITTRNNIWEANRYVVEYIPTTLLSPVDWDHDDLWTNDTAGAGRFVKWLNVRYADCAALAALATIEPSCLEVRPAYDDAAAGDLTLVAGHPLLDAGVLIPGINQVLPGTHDDFVVGAGPDIGAFERGGVVPGPDALPDVLRADVARELPATPDTTFGGVRFPWRDPDLVLVNPVPRLLFYEAVPLSRLIIVRKDVDTVRLDLLP